MWLADSSIHGAMTIEAILDALKVLPEDHLTPHGWDECYSYRGYYSELAVNRALTTIRIMRATLEDAIGQTFQGYKGGDYTMTNDTGVWRADYGVTGPPITPDTITLIKAGL